MQQHPIIELDLGNHTLILTNNGSMELFAQAGDGIDLDSEETYRLYMALHARFQPVTPEEEAAVWD
jgi:hypothetical protein